VTTNSNNNLERVWKQHHAEWRTPVQVASQWKGAEQVNPVLLEWKTRGAWWDTLEETKSTLFVSREYENLLVAISVVNSKPCFTYFPMPHPSGLAVDRRSQKVYVASTRNPNQIFEFKPVESVLPRLDRKIRPPLHKPLIPSRSWFLPGCLYIHDLAFIGGDLHANAVGMNSIVSLPVDGGFERKWWPSCMENKGNPIFSRNHIQLNSIAPSQSLESSFFSASSDLISRRRPGHLNYPVDKKGVIFSGKTREVFSRGLTRPHSARIFQNNVWVDNSGYGEVVVAEENSTYIVVNKCSSWTRGLAFCGNFAFVGSSRVIPRYRCYAPGLDAEKSECGVHALDTKTGKWLGCLVWPHGNQIFGLDYISSDATLGFAGWVDGKRESATVNDIYYAFDIK